MPATYEPIATTTLSSAANSITFNSIPGTYTDLKLVFVGRANAVTANVLVTFNGDSGTNYSRTNLNGTGSSATSARDTNTVFIHLTAYTGLDPTQPSLRVMDVFNYAGSTNKTCLTEENADYNGSGAVVRGVQLWRNTAAITSLTISSNSGGAYPFAAGTTATLYGIKAA